MKECCREHLAAQFGDDAIAGEIYAEYKADASAKAAELSAALAAGDWTGMDRAAHALKGAALSAGDPETAESAIALRKAAAERDAARAAEIFRRVEGLVRAL